MKKNEPPPKTPEVIIIDDRTEGKDNNYKDPNEPFGSYSRFGMRKDGKYPFVLRLLYALGALCALGWVIGSSMCLVIFSLIAAVTFFRVKLLNAFVIQSWSFLKTSIVGLISGIIAVFSPPLGIGLFLMYISMQQDSSGGVFLQRIFKNFFDKK